MSRTEPKDQSAASQPQLEPTVKRSFDETMDFAAKFADRVHNNSLSDLIFVEIFSGTAGLTAAVRKLGFAHSLGIDAHVNKQVKSPVLRIDLSSSHGQALLWRILRQPRVFAVH